ncbi:MULTISPECIES: ectoine/hydroxyectoine ABC transporter permease subunit EhuD [unclassified Dinoroseobacter]|uniref:ectoine/hydroxyectoine ABC transporter permease subunit EhuD n=1 Tax=unclassified Dinoroseobacter TaxID=2620028 RepID=UPI003C7E9430
MDWSWEFTFDRVLPALLQALPVTIQATVFSFLLAVALGLPLMLLRKSPIRIVALVVGEIIEFIRGTPLLVQIFFLFFVLPEFGLTLPPLTTGILAIGIYYSALCSEVFRAGFDAVPRGQWEAARALNLSPVRTLTGIIIPQSLPPIVPALGNFLIAIFKETPLLSFVAVAEIMQVAKGIGIETYRFTEAITVAGILFLILSLIAAALVGMVERYVNRKVYH